MDFRKTFDTIPEQFDKWRTRYCEELYTEVISCADLGRNKAVLEIGPGTGQATEPFLKTGCDYLAIELGEHFAAFMENKFGSYRNFHIVNDDFETHNFQTKKFDLVYSAATIQWIPETIGFPKVFDLLKPGGTFAMFMTYSDYKSGNEDLYEQMLEVYRKHFYVETKYTCRLDYEHVLNYGFVDLNYFEWKKERVLNADEYVDYLAGTQVEHITLKEPYKTRFYEAIRKAVMNAGNQIKIIDTIALYITKKPELNNSSL